MKIKAKMFATMAHKNQLRKLSKKPYISHPIRVAKYLEDNGAPEELICAGYLHDVVEDSTFTLDQVEHYFGKRVSHIVAAHTEDKTKSWKERKTETIKQVKEGSKDIKWLIVADKLDNLKDIQEQSNELKTSIWDHFNAGKDDQAWYFTSIAQYMYDNLKEEDIPPFFHTYEQVVKDVFH